MRSDENVRGRLAIREVSWTKSIIRSQRRFLSSDIFSFAGVVCFYRFTCRNAMLCLDHDKANLHLHLVVFSKTHGGRTCLFTFKKITTWINLLSACNCTDNTKCLPEFATILRFDAFVILYISGHCSPLNNVKCRSLPRTLALNKLSLFSFECLRFASLNMQRVWSLLVLK